MSRQPRPSRSVLRAAGVMVLAAALLPAMAYAAEDDPRDGPRAGLLPVERGEQQHRAARQRPARRAVRRASRQLRLRQLRPRVHRRPRHRRQLQRLPGLRHLRSRRDPTLRGSFVCPGGQGDVSVYGNLLFMSVEETRGRIDCGTQGAPGAVNLERFRGVRIFDISDIDNPVQLPGVQTCRGSHTHTIVTDPDDPDNIYIYNSGTSGVRPAAELAGLRERRRSRTTPVTTGNPTQWRIDVIKVPLAAPADGGRSSASRGSSPTRRRARSTACRTRLPAPLHPSGTPYSPTPNTNTCHDITAYPAIGLAAGACQGNGILLDISDPVNPVRLDAVVRPELLLLALGDVQQRRHQGDLHRRVGRRHERPLPGDRPAASGAPTRSSTSSTARWSSPATTRCRRVQTTQENCVAHNALARAGARPRHPRPGVVPGRPVGDRLHRHGEPDRDRLLRPWADQHAEPDRAQPRRPLVDVLVQRQRLRQRDRSRLRHVRRSPPSDQLSENEIDAASRGRSSTSSTPSTRRRSCWAPSFAVAGVVLRPGRPLRRARRGATLDTASRSTSPRRRRSPTRRRRVGEGPARQRHPGP